jgi:hypothetical protein
VVGYWVSQWSQDIGIWENKVYLDRPLLAKDDGPLPKMRRWYSQFYPQDEVPARASSEPLPAAARDAGMASSHPTQLERATP